MPKPKKAKTDCIFCGGQNSKKRVKIGKTHCVAPACVAEWRRRRNDDKGLVPILAHKQGLMWVTRDQVAKNDMKRAGGL